ncbi:MAG: Uncharacterised protein [Arcobacter lacus]|nr:MAG: Uncharacterised protein [Arcobacter lacus]
MLLVAVLFNSIISSKGNFVAYAMPDITDLSEIIVLLILGFITSTICSALSAKNKNISAMFDLASPPNAIVLNFNPSSVPPGSFVRIASGNLDFSISICVDLPAVSIPSITAYI